MKYVYHFYAMRQRTDGSVTHIDGVFTRESPIITGDDYNGVKTAIVEDGRNWTLCSLSLLSTVEEDDVD